MGERVVIFAVVLAACGGSSGGDGDGGGGGGGIDAGTADAAYVPPYASCAGEGAPTTPPSGSLCLVPMDPGVGTVPLAVIEHEFVTYEGVPAVHIRIVLDPTFADNTYGANTIGWSRDHKFGDLVGSDHCEVVVLNSAGEVVFDFWLDYLTADASAPCGYSSLGVSGGEGRVNLGDESAILAWTSSIDTNLNDRGYCDGYLVDSPATDAMCTPNPAAPDWDFRVVYEVWIALSAFDPTAFGSAYMSSVHASPSKFDTNTVEVEPGECPCPEDVDTSQCEPPPTTGDCVNDSECGDNEFCYDSHCVPIID
jgi:hypothetical protein